MRIKCPLCSFECEDIMVLVGHLLSAHRQEEQELQREYSEQLQEEAEEQRLYSCDFCGKTFASYEAAKQHILSEHKEELEKKIEEQREQEKKPKKRAKK